MESSKILDAVMAELHDNPVYVERLFGWDICNDYVSGPFTIGYSMTEDSGKDMLRYGIDIGKRLKGNQLAWLVEAQHEDGDGEERSYGWIIIADTAEEAAARLRSAATNQTEMS